jgi:SAM-dependent methyltransferase
MAIPAAIRSDPLAGPAPHSRLGRQAWRTLHRLRELLGIRRSFKVGGVYYKETSAELIWRALSVRGTGHKQLRVTFPDGSKLLIHCTAERVYADAMGPALLPQYQRAAALVRPGMRVLDMGCGTGYTASWLAGRVGPSGAIVAIDPDQESITFAHKRYIHPNVAFEVGAIEALAGETNGAFDAACCLTMLRAGAPDQPLVKELARVVAPGGWLLVGAPLRPSAGTRTGPVGQGPQYDLPALTALLESSTGDGPQPVPPTLDVLSTPDEDFLCVLVRKPEP